MGDLFCNEEKSQYKNHNTYNIKQNINNNIHISKVNNNFNYPINNNNFFNNNNYSNNCCCPSCGEPAGKNFKGSGSDYESFICLKCGNHQSVANYYKCNICNGIFCSQCPFNNYSNNNYNRINRNNNNSYSCPACGEPAGSNFKGSGSDYESFTCLKCGEKQSVANYYKCNNCNRIFCSQCPSKNNYRNNSFKKNNTLYSCPACGEPAGRNFKGSGKDYESFFCLKCGNHQSVANYYMCNKCRGIFCSQCPDLNDGIFAKCPSCGEPAGRKFKGSGKDYESFNCLKCGKSQSVSNYYKCNNCKGIFCYSCPFNNY